MTDLLLQLNKWSESISMFLLAPGDYTARVGLDLAERWFACQPDGAGLMMSGPLATAAAVLFWGVLCVETWLILRGLRAGYNTLQSLSRLLADRVIRVIRRYRIQRACSERGADNPAVSTFVQEFSEPGELAVTALRLAGDNAEYGTLSFQHLKEFSGSTTRDLRRALNRLEQLQFINREQSASGNTAYRATPAGQLYLQACDATIDQDA